MIIALAAIGACFGTFAIALVLAVLPRFMAADKELLQTKLELEKLKTDFAEGLAELQEQAAQDETGMLMPRVDPVTGASSWVKAVEGQPMPQRFAPTLDIDNIEELIKQHERQKVQAG